MATEPLDLSGADTTAFEPIPSGRYIVHVEEVEWRKASGEGKLPADTPMLNTRFVVDSDVKGDTTHEGRSIYTNYSLPAADVENAAKMRGIFTRFLMAATGEEEATITSGKYKLDVEDLIGRQVVASVGVRQSEGYDPQNTVKGVRSLSEAAPDSGGLL